MATLYGSLVGTPKLATFPPTLVDKAYERTGQMILVRDTITLAAAAIGATIYAQQLGWETVLDPYGCVASFGALGAGTTISLGDATHPTALDNAVATAAAAQKQLISAPPIGSYWQPLWQLLGYPTLAAAQAVGLQCVLLFTIGGAAASGVLTWRLEGERRD